MEQEEEREGTIELRKNVAASRTVLKRNGVFGSWIEFTFFPCVVMIF